LSKKPYTVGRVVLLLALLFFFPSNALHTQAQELETVTNIVPADQPSPASKSLAGKTIWIVDVNSNEGYNSPLQEALLDQLPQYAPGLTVRHVTTSEKGNPFFILRRENYPDAAIVSLGVCMATTKDVANYASGAKKKGIPSVMCYISEVRDHQKKWNKAYRLSDAEAIEIEEVPQSRNEAEPVAKRLVPIFIEKLKY